MGMEAAVPVREIMTREFVAASETDTVGDAVDLMLTEGAAGAVVLRGTEPVGMLTADDALVLLSGEDESTDAEVRTAMSATVPSVDPDAPVADAAGEMADAGVGALLVRDGNEVLGVVSEGDVVRATAALADRTSPTEPVEPADAETMAAAADVAGPTGETTEGEYSSQSVCEVCGSLTPDLRNFNGQLICGDCREV